MKKIINICCLVLGLFFLFPTLSYAQEKTLIRGTVIGNDGEPLIRATITERDKDNRILSSAVTDIDGNYSINVTNPNNKLSFRYIGFKEQIIVPGKNHVLDVTLEDASVTTNEVTITAKATRNLGGLGIDERDISMAMSKINADELEGLHTASVDDALQGRMSGVDIVGNTGNPGGGMSIRVRGLTSMSGNNQPLIVVDGVPVETNIGSTDASFDLANATEEEFSQMLNIPPSDIQEIVVLKDAAASAIYGSKGANGVLLITTKRGSVSPPKISLQSTFTLNAPRERIPTLSGYQYTTMINEAMFNSGRVLSTTSYPEFAYDPNNPEYYYNYSNNTDWVKAITKKGFAQDYNLSLSGGSRKVRYFFSSGYWDETGTTIGTGYQRLNTRANLNYSVSDKLRFQADIAYTHSTKQMNFIPEGSNYTKGDLASKAYIKMPNQSIYYYNIYGEQTSLYYTPYTNVQGTFPSVYNPVAMARDSKNTITSDDVKPNFVLTYDFASAWQFSFNVSFQIGNNKTKQYLPQSASGLLWNNSQTNWASDGDGDSFTMQTISKLRWIPQFKNDKVHKLITQLAYNTYDSRGNSYYEASSNLPSTFLQDPSVASRVYPYGSLSSGSSQHRTISATANANYTLLDRYIIYGSIRMDGDSRFGSNYRYGYFPALSGRYRISGESFMKDIKWINDLSVRASWGVNGNTPDRDYIFYSRYSNYDWYYLGNAATYPTGFALDDLRWEVITQKNLGLNFIGFNNRVNMEFEYYVKRSDDNISSSVSIPSTSGYATATLNTNDMENIGWELNVMTTPIVNKDWKVDLSFNVARSQNFVREITPYSTTEDGDWRYNGEYLTRTEVNQTYGAFYGYLYDGVYLNKDQTIAKDKNGNKIYTMGDNGQLEPVYMKFGYPSIGYEFQAGDARYKDINNDGNINLQDVVYLGDYNPLFYGGFGPTIKYKNFTINSWFVYRYGNDIMNMTRMTMENMYGFNNQSTSVLRRFTESYAVGSESDAPADLLPRALYSKGYNWLGSSRFIEDGSFLRWKTATLRYNLPKKFVKAMGISDLNMWFTMQNIYVWTNYTGQDPEVSVSGSSPGEDGSRAPRPYQFTFGFKFGL